MNDHELIKRIDTLMQAREDMLLARIHAITHHAKDQIMTAVEQATASLQAKMDALSAEVVKANAKTDAALAALAASVASGEPVTQADIDAINAIGTQADAATASLQAEESKVDAATGGDAAAASSSAQGASSTT